MTVNQTRGGSNLMNRRNQELTRIINPNPTSPQPEPEPELEPESSDRFEHLAEFVEWAQTITTKPAGVPMSWCSQWDQHAREKETLAALWGAYEKVKEDPTSYLDWFHIHFMALIENMTQPNGPLSSCQNGHKTPIKLGAS